MARGSIPYSAVTQPLPVPLRNGGTRSSTEAAQRTFVSPSATSAEPSACRATPVSMVTARISEGLRPSGRGVVRVIGDPSGRRPRRDRRRQRRHRRGRARRRRRRLRRRRGSLRAGRLDDAADVEERAGQVHVASERFGGFAVDEDSHTGRLGHVLQDGVDEGGDDRELLVGTEGEAGIDREIEHGLAFRQEEGVAQLHLLRQRADEALAPRPLLELLEEERAGTRRRRPVSARRAPRDGGAGRSGPGKRA